MAVSSRVVTTLYDVMISVKGGWVESSTGSLPRLHFQAGIALNVAAMIPFCITVKDFSL
jgi:hypothetical protein